MRFSVICAGVSAAILVVSAAPASASYIYGPDAAYETTEGNLNNVVFSHTDSHTQWVFAPTVFGATAVTINKFSLRFDADVTNFYGNAGKFALGNGFSVKLASIDGLASQNFAANLANAVTVMSGAQAMDFTIGGPAGATKPWGVTFDFSTPYAYDPTAGSSLLIDLAIPGQDMFGTMDFIADYYQSPTANTPGYRVFNRDPSAVSGQLQLFAPVVRFDVTPQISGVPEPMTWMLLILGFASAGAVLRRRRLVEI